MAESSLPQAEKKYLAPLKKIYNKYGKFKNKTLENIKAGQKDYLDWCILNQKQTFIG